MPTYDSQAPPLTPFQNSMSGPAGEYSDAYKAIVQQYRDDVASAKALRDQQSGIPPLQPVAGLIHKSGNDIVRVDPYTGAATLSYRAPAPPLRPQNPFVDPRELQNMRASSAKELEFLRSAHSTLKAAQTRFQKLTDDPNTPSDELMQAGLDVKDAQDQIAGMSSPVAPPLNPVPALTNPTATATAPAYHPAPMMAPGEIPPPGSIVIGGRNRLDAPPRTTQSAAKRFKYVNGQLIAQ